MRRHVEPNLRSGPFRLYATLCKPSRPRAGVLFAHGMCSDHKEMGIFTRLERRLVEMGYATMRFDFRSHGESEGRPEDMSIRGEIKDLEGAFSLLAKHVSRSRIALVAASFGASIFALSSRRRLRISTAVLLNPVTDFAKTFLRPVTPWGRQNFGMARISSGRPIQLDECQLGGELVRDLARFEPANRLSRWKIPILLIHGDKDEAVPYSTSRHIAAKYDNIYLSTIPGAGHGFDNWDKRRLVIDLTTQWLSSKLVG
jgi:pimeloyl-ACP methyl ester carboxylesterase